MIPFITQSGDAVTIEFPACKEAFASLRAAERYLEDRGFSVGRWQERAPCGFILGDNYDIQKWRNLRPIEVLALHGRIEGDGRHGPVTITLSPDAPTEVRDALLKAVTAPRRTLGRFWPVANDAVSVVTIMLALVAGWLLLNASFRPAAERQVAAGVKIEARAEPMHFGYAVAPLRGSVP